MLKLSLHGPGGWKWTRSWLLMGIVALATAGCDSESLPGVAISGGNDVDWVSADASADVPADAPVSDGAEDDAAGTGVPPRTCGGNYWIFAGRDGGGWAKIWVELDVGATGGVHGWAFEADRLSEITGQCDLTAPGQPGWIVLVRAEAIYRQFYVGEYVFDGESGQTTMAGSWSVEGGQDHPFEGFTLLDDSQPVVGSADEALSLRRRLIRHVWGTDELPFDRSPERIEEDVDPPLDGLGSELAGVDLLVVAMEEGFYSHVYHFRPSRPVNRLVVFHQGHSHRLHDFGGFRTIRALLEHGFDVMALYMPALGPNQNPLGPMGDHYFVFTFDQESHPYHVFKFFLEPITVALNHAAEGFDLIAMVGISGGGWTASVYAALDPRIQRAVAVAGSLPLSIRTSWGDIGDWEQFQYDFYRQAGYADLYVLGSMGAGRAHVQVLTELAQCCFSRTEPPAYARIVSEVVADLGLGGEFSVQIDLGQQVHEISEWAVESVILPVMEGDVAEP